MASSSSCSWLSLSPSCFIHFKNKQFSIPKQSISKTLIPSSSISLSVSLSKHYPSLVITNCSGPSTESHEFPSTVIFIKGFPLSTSEGPLKKVFSQFGDVSRVKLVLGKKTKQSSGFAFVWFTREESAQLAVKEMDGKFFDGRFISVTMAKPGSCKTPRNAAPYKF